MCQKNECTITGGDYGSRRRLWVTRVLAMATDRDEVDLEYLEVLEARCTIPKVQIFLMQLIASGIQITKLRRPEDREALWRGLNLLCKHWEGSGRKWNVASVNWIASVQVQARWEIQKRWTVQPRRTQKEQLSVMVTTGRSKRQRAKPRVWRARLIDRVWGHRSTMRRGKNEGKWMYYFSGRTLNTLERVFEIKQWKFSYWACSIINKVPLFSFTVVE
jgi:hypothetical protein